MTGFTHDVRRDTRVKVLRLLLLSNNELECLLNQINELTV